MSVSGKRGYMSVALLFLNLQGLWNLIHAILPFPVSIRVCQSIEKLCPRCLAVFESWTRHTQVGHTNKFNISVSIHLKTYKTAASVLCSCFLHLDFCPKARSSKHRPPKVQTHVCGWGSIWSLSGP